jgi:hypothetical protein
MNSSPIGTNHEGASKNLTSISPFFIVRNLQTSIADYRQGLGFELDVLPCPNHTRHEWARWDAYIYTTDPDTLFAEFSQRGVSFVKTLSFIDEGLWGFEIADADGCVLAFFRLRNR